MLGGSPLVVLFPLPHSPASPKENLSRPGWGDSGFSDWGSFGMSLKRSCLFYQETLKIFKC